MKGVNRKMRVILIIFQKMFVWGKWTILDPKMAHSHNSWSALRIFLKFNKIKGANRYMKILLVVFREKKFILGNLIFLAFRSFFTLGLDMVEIEPGHC